MVTLLVLAHVLAQDSGQGPFPGRYMEAPEASKPIRQQQFNQIAGYLERLRQRAGEIRGRTLNPDYSSPEAYAKSVEPLRATIRERIGYPPPLVKTDAPPRYEHVADDAYATLYRMYYEVLEGVELYAILSVPKGLTRPAPLLICQHGGGGSPEVIAPMWGDLGDGTANYGWMVQRALKEGYVTWSPALIFRRAGTEALEGPDRVPMDKQLRNVGTSILAIELYKIVRGLDEVLKRPEVDPDRVGMMGLSYGGLYTQFAAALDPRIDVAVSSCFFNDRLLYSWDDWSFFNYLNEFTDPEVCALICPRPLMIEVGVKDELFTVEGARSQVEATRKHWDRLGVPDRFAYVEFDGGHEFWGEQAYAFVGRYLK